MIRRSYTCGTLSDMRIRTVFPLLLPLLILSLLVACGGDDDDSSSTPSATTTKAASATGTPTEEPTATPEDTGPTPTPQLIATPARTLPADADVLALLVLDVLTFLTQEVPGQAPVAVPCSSFEEEEAIIDCTAEGQGRIALDPPPSGGTNWACRALLRPADNTLFAASCVPSEGTTAFFYSVEP